MLVDCMCSHKCYYCCHLFLNHLKKKNICSNFTYKLYDLQRMNIIQKNMFPHSVIDAEIQNVLM